MGNLIWRESKVKDETGLSKSTRWRLMRAGQFPQKVQLGPRAVGWRAEEIIRWSKDRCEARNEPPVRKNKTATPTDSDPGAPGETP
jgi:prophage regulatory protein